MSNRNFKKHNRNLFIAFAIIFLSALGVKVYGQTDTCYVPVCNPVVSNDTRQVIREFRLLRNAVKSSSVISGNLFRQDSATAAFNRMYAVSYTSLQNLQSIASNTGRITTTNNRLVTGDSKTVAQWDSTISSSLGIYLPALFSTGGGITSVGNSAKNTWTNTTFMRTFLTDQVDNSSVLYTLSGHSVLKTASNSQSAFLDSISGHQYSVANEMQMIRTGGIPVTNTVTMIFGGGGVTPTVAVTGTVNTNVTNTVTTSETAIALTKTYSRQTASGTQTITSGAKMISIANIGTTNANVDGIILDPGASVSFPINGKDTYPSTTYDCLTSTLLVIVIR